MIEGGCRCGAIRYAIDGEALHHALCHCRDCQMGSGAPMVAWSAYHSADFHVTQGEPVMFNGEGASLRYFCGTCGTPLYFVNQENLPGLVDVHSVTLDDPDAAAPQVHIQMADRRQWMDGLADLPQFERYPG